MTNRFHSVPVAALMATVLFAPALGWAQWAKNKSPNGWAQNDLRFLNRFSAPSNRGTPNKTAQPKRAAMQDNDLKYGEYVAISSRSHRVPTRPVGVIPNYNPAGSSSGAPQPIQDLSDQATGSWAAVMSKGVTLGMVFSDPHFCWEVGIGANVRSTVALYSGDGKLLLTLPDPKRRLGLTLETLALAKIPLGKGSVGAGFCLTGLPLNQNAVSNDLRWPYRVEHNTWFSPNGYLVVRASAGNVSIDIMVQPKNGINGITGIVDADSPVVGARLSVNFPD